MQRLFLLLLLLFLCLKRGKKGRIRYKILYNVVFYFCFGSFEVGYFGKGTFDSDFGRNIEFLFDKFEGFVGMFIEKGIEIVERSRKEVA